MATKAKAKNPLSPEHFLDLSPTEIQKRLDHVDDKLTAAVSLRRAALKREDGEQDVVKQCDDIDTLLHRRSLLMIARDAGKNA